MKLINNIMDEETVLETVMDFLITTVPCWTGYEESEAGRLFEVFQDEILKDSNTKIIGVDLILMPERGIVAYDRTHQIYIKYSLYLPIIGNGKYREAIHISNDAQNWRPVIAIVNTGDDNSEKHFYPDLLALDDPLEDCIINDIICAYRRF